MKNAVTLIGSKIAASENAPKRAFCPKCSGKVTLRYRRLMANGGTIYFWRHMENQQLCRRPSPMMRITVRYAT